MKLKYIALTFILQFLSAMSHAAWKLDAEASHLSFITTKQGNISEVQSFTGLQGSINNAMHARILIDSSSISTNIDIRNERIRSLLLDSNILPNIYLRSQLPESLINDMAAGSAVIYLLKGTVELHGIRKSIKNYVLITKTDSRITVSSLKPIVINSEDYAMSSGIEALRIVAKLSSISTQIPVSFYLSYIYSDEDEKTSFPPKPAAATATSIAVRGVEVSVNWDSNEASNFIIQYRIDESPWRLAGIASGSDRAYAFSPASNGNIDVRLITIKDGRSSDVSLMASTTITEVGDNGGASSTPSGGDEDPSDGTALWAKHGCAGCHGEKGDGGSYNIPLLDSLAYPFLATYIAEEMPYSNPAGCDEACGNEIAKWMRENLGDDSSPSSISSNSNSSISSHSNSSSNSGPDTRTGKELYATLCSACHGSDGKGNTPITGAIRRPNLQVYIVENMPYGSPDSCDADCSLAIIEWMRNNFDAPEDDSPITPPNLDSNSILKNLSTSKARELLYKTSINLLGRIPTEQEYAALKDKGNQHLSNIIDTQLQDDLFIGRVKVIFNDLLLTQEWDSKDGFHSYLRNYSWQSFEDADTEWIKQDSSIPYYTTIRRYISNGHSRSPLELISHVIKNNKPFSEILTADYAMLNWYGAKSFNLEGTENFRDLPLEEQKNKDFPKDPNHFLPVQLPNVPSAGILTSGVYMLKYRTTSTNRNRNRAYTFFKNFLDTDILAIGGERPGDSESSHEYPTMTDPNCTTCHKIMDPVASSFKHWISFAGQGRPFYDKTPRANEWNSSHILPAGFNGKQTPTDVDPLPWLAAEAVQDPRFAKAMVKAVFQDMTGVAFIPATVDGVDFQSPAYLEQQAFIEAVAKQFRVNNLNFKSMIKTLLISQYALGQHSSPMEKLLLTPEQLNKKIKSTLGHNWDNWLNTWNVLYGGINSSSVTVRNQNVNGLITTIQLRMAEDMACKITAKEFSVAANKRLLLGDIEPNILPNTEANTAKIKQVIIDVYERLIGEKLEVNDETIIAAFDVYESALSLGKKGIDSGNISTRITRDCAVSKNQAEVNKDFVFDDGDYYTRAWQALFQFVLMDPRYFYL